jgi:hypothetical protein
MAQCEEGRRRDMSISQGFLTKQWAILVKSRRDAGMASISCRYLLGKATSLPKQASARYVRHSSASKARLIGPDPRSSLADRCPVRLKQGSLNKGLKPVRALDRTARPSLKRSPGACIPSARAVLGGYASWPQGCRTSHYRALSGTAICFQNRKHFPGATRPRSFRHRPGRMPPSPLGATASLLHTPPRAPVRGRL